MGLSRLVTWSVVGPLVLWSVLVGHVVLRLAYVESPPAETLNDLEEDAVEERRVLVKDFQRVLAKGEPDRVRRFIEESLDERFVWEDPMERLEGKEEFSDFMYLSKYVKDIEFDVSSESHSVDETVVDWKLKVFLSFLPDSPFVLPMRTHFVYAQAETSPKNRKLVKIFEEWYGLSHLTRENTRPSILGHLHEKLRRFFGLGLSYLVRTGLV